MPPKTWPNDASLARSLTPYCLSCEKADITVGERTSQNSSEAKDDRRAHKKETETERKRNGD